ncbi:endolytic transglycosylase MltG [Bifidobacterium mongoliense]|uniref:endolytic transglycosylase MltG n=1 Tax=Bifidobacterium mongoliense TaxID=518643 RepID=UPI0030EC7CE7
MVEDLNDWFDDTTDQTSESSVAPSEPPTPPKSRREMRRRRRSHRRHTATVVIVSVVIVSLVAALMTFGYVRLKRWSDSRNADNTQVVDYPGPGSGSLAFTVSSGEGVSQVGARLVKAGVVKSAALFASAVAANSSTLYPGTFTLRYRMSSTDVVKILSDQSKAAGILEVRSGERVSDVIEAAAKQSGIAIGKFRDVINAGGAGILPAEAQGKYEGWFAPGSYNVTSLKSVDAIIKAMVDRRVAQLDTLGVPTGAERERVLTLASIAESEVNSTEYYGKVTRVILNRIAKNMPLGMDTTVAYGLGIKADALTDAMLNDASNQYNTRIHKGLPPSPISNPGDNAISAAVHPESGDWLYFVTTNMKTGETKFATTEDQFWKIRQEYKNSNDNAN